MRKTNQLFIFMGPSGSGKTTIAEKIASQMGFNIVSSYTTRTQRFENETGHKFITVEDYIKLPNKIAPVLYDRTYYCTTISDLLENEIYIAEPSALDTLAAVKDIISFCVIYIDVPENIRASRMKDRGDSEGKIQRRIENDREMFSSVVKNKCDIIVDNSRDIDYSVGEIVNFIKRREKI